MAHAVEARVPFLDREVIEWALRVPASAKLRPGRAGEEAAARGVRRLAAGRAAVAQEGRVRRRRRAPATCSRARSRPTVSDEELEAERGAVEPPLRTKEEVAYYRVWREHLQDISAERTLSRFARA